MCNVAGYIGSERAAPILLDMMEKQEGFGGGRTGLPPARLSRAREG